jgi:hypothetical protein
MSFCMMNRTLILHELLFFWAANFHAYLRGLAVPCHRAVCGRDGLTRDFGRGRHENLSGAISWLTFFAGGAADARGIQSDCTAQRWVGYAVLTVLIQSLAAAMQCIERKALAVFSRRVAMRRSCLSRLTHRSIKLWGAPATAALSLKVQVSS